jgi:hypothetical protein
LRWEQLPAFFQALEQNKANGSHITICAVKVLFMTFLRVGSMTPMRWSELDYDQDLWIIPAERMKSGKEHVVPLTDPLKELRAPLQVAFGSHVDRFEGNRHTIIDVGPIDNPFERVHGAFGRQKLIPPLQTTLDVPHDGLDISRRPVLGANRSSAFQKDGGYCDAAEHELPGVLGSGAKG